MTWWIMRCIRSGTRRSGRGFAAFGGDRGKGVLGTRIDEPVRLSPRQREEAIEALAPDMRRLSEEYGIDVGKWGWKA